MTSPWGKAITEDDIEEICSLRRDEKMTIPEISERTGRAEITIKRYLFKNGLSMREPRRKTEPFSVVQYQQVKLIQMSGKTSAEVAAQTGLQLAEVNGAYGTGNYQYYLDHR